MATLSLKRPLSRSRLSGVGVAALAAERAEPEPAPATVEPRGGDKATWRERMAVDLHAMTGGETPAAFRWLVGAEGPALALMVGAREAFVARWPEADGAAVRGWLARLCRSKQYLAALAEEGADRFDLDGRPVGPVSAKHRALAVAMRSKGAEGQVGGGKAGPAGRMCGEGAGAR